jgi:hypothetical protein
METKIEPPDDSLEAVNKASLVSGKETEKPPLVDSGLSSIEKSEAVVAILIPFLNTPILVIPSKHAREPLVFAVSPTGTKDQAYRELVDNLSLTNHRLVNQVLEIWEKTLEEEAELVRQQVNSPYYQKLKGMLLKKRLSRPADIPDEQGISSTSSEDLNADPIVLVTTLDRLHSFERLIPIDSLSSVSSEQSPDTAVVVSLMAALLMGGGLATLNSLEITTAWSEMSSHPLSQVMGLVEQLQPLLPLISAQEMISLINLMVVGPLYYHSWNEAVSHFKQRERRNEVQIAQKFAKDVIHMLGDPVLMASLLKRMEGIHQLSAEEQERLACLLKVVLIGIALGLLYAVEVGKVQQGKFGGLAPEELRELLLGKFMPVVDENQKPTEHQRLITSLIKRLHEQLVFLKAEDKVTVVGILLGYLGQVRDYNAMLVPTKIFDETLASSDFHPQDKRGMQG